MTNGNLLLDTNTVSAALKYESAVVDRIARSNGIAIPSIVLGELFFGAFQSARREDNLRTYEAIALNNTILTCDAATARVYGAIKAGVRAKGRPIPDNDLWIAALAIQHQLTLLTRDAHFEHVESLSLERW